MTLILTLLVALMILITYGAFIIHPILGWILVIMWVLSIAGLFQE